MISLDCRRRRWLFLFRPGIDVILGCWQTVANAKVVLNGRLGLEGVEVWVVKVAEKIQVVALSRRNWEVVILPFINTGWEIRSK